MNLVGVTVNSVSHALVPNSLDKCSFAGQEVISDQEHVNYTTSFTVDFAFEEVQEVIYSVKIIF